VTRKLGILEWCLARFARCSGYNANRIIEPVTRTKVSISDDFGDNRDAKRVVEKKAPDNEVCPPLNFGLEYSRFRPRLYLPLAKS